MPHLRSPVVRAARDVLGLLLAGLVGGSLLAEWCLHVEARTWSALGVPLGTGAVDAVRLAGAWLRMLAPFALAVWCAARGRSRARAPWLPAWVAAGLVAVGTVLAVAPWPGGVHLVDTWPGPDLPLVPAHDGSWTPGLTPAWGYPVLSAAVLVSASWLGVRAGRADVARQAADEPPAHVPVRAGMSPLAATVLGIPATAAAAAAVAATLVVSTRFSPTSEIDWSVATGPLWWLGLALVAAALLSGTGPLGVAATGAALLPSVVIPLHWWLGGGDDLLLAQAAASVVAGAVVAAWRPCAAWAAGALVPAAPPAPAVSEPSS